MTTTDITKIREQSESIEPQFILGQQVDSYSRPVAIRVLRLPEVIERVGLRRASIYMHMMQGKFPKQISLSSRAVGWLESEIDTWLASRVQQARAIAPSHLSTR